MEFLSQVPQMVLSETPGKQSAFCADVFKPRPPFAQIQSFAPWGVSLQNQFEEAMERESCPVAWMGMFVDQEGMMALFHFKHPVILGHAKTAIGTILKSLSE